MSISVEQFCDQGFVVIREAVAPADVLGCVRAIETAVWDQHVDLNVPETWTRPVVRIPCPEGLAFTAAGTSPKLRAAYDDLLGVGGWVERAGVGGTVPIRFPSSTDPGDAGWHIDGSYDVAGQWWVNVHSRGRGLLALFLFSDIGVDDAPTEILVGSHLDVPRALAPYGERGTFFGNVTTELADSTYERRRAWATGSAGDVYLCHPFLVHRATWPHRGTRPRILAQPEVRTRSPFALERGDGACAVERSIVRGLTT
jgi:hypothetical protein